jgi:hypothetical protein
MAIPVTEWDYEGPPDRPTMQVTEGPGPEHCDQQDRTDLWISKVGTYVRHVEDTLVSVSPLTSGDDVVLPGGAAYTGWHSGERQLWIDMTAYPSWYMPKGEHPDAIYIVSPSGVEWWSVLTVFCI